MISGNQEAEYIYLGNKIAYDWGKRTVLILDIGGGSNECIICNSDTILWKKSFENGMQRIANTIPLSYPFTDSILNNIQLFLSETFAELKTACANYSIDVLIGSSGPFDTFRDLVLKQRMLHTFEETFFEFSLSDLLRIHTSLISSSKIEIGEMPGMDSARIELLPIASCITQYMLSEFSIPHVVQSKYSLKEGVIQTILQSS